MSLKEEMLKLIKSGTGHDMKCPNCKKVCHRGGGLVNHWLNYCKVRKLTFKNLFY